MPNFDNFHSIFKIIFTNLKMDGEIEEIAICDLLFISMKRGEGGQLTKKPPCGTRCNCIHPPEFFFTLYCDFHKILRKM
jgi:hypothetical protein